VRYGRGFTLVELKGAGLTAAFARTVGISVDHRRTSTSEEQLQLNVARLNTYKSKLIVFPRRENKPKKGLINDATAEQLKSAATATQVTGITLPLVRKVQEIEFAAIKEEDKKSKVFHTLRTIRTNHRYKGRRDKKATDEKKAKE
jgi:large subunit ribosomal protein L13e